MKIKTRERLIKVLIACMFVLLIVIMVQADDPPKSKKDTTKIDIQQMQEVNAAMGKRSMKMDSLLMQMDSLKQKK